MNFFLVSDAWQTQPSKQPTFGNAKDCVFKVIQHDTGTCCSNHMPHGLICNLCELCMVASSCIMLYIFMSLYFNIEIYIRYMVYMNIYEYIYIYICIYIYEYIYIYAYTYCTI